MKSAWRSPMEKTTIATELLVGSAPVTIQRRVKWGECDPAGVVYMVNYGEYVVSAYELLMAALLDEGLQKSKARHGVALPAKAFGIEFYAPLHPDEDFLMTVEIADIRTRTFDLMVRGSSVVNGSVFLAKLTPIAVDPTARTALPLPEGIVHKLRHYREACTSKNAPMGDV
jgi:acyl-CoA thioesterase FadM